MGVRVDRSSSEAKILLVHPGKAAEMAGLMANDVVLRFDDSVVLDAAHLIELISGRQPGEEVQVTIKRGDEEFAIPILLGKR